MDGVVKDLTFSAANTLDQIKKIKSFVMLAVLRRNVSRVRRAHPCVIATVATQLLSKKGRKGGEPLATLYPI